MLNKRKYHYISKNRKLERRVWTFGILFLLFSGYLMWNNYELPKFFFGKTDHSIGQIYHINLRTGIRGIGQIQAVKYFYEVDGIYYHGAKLVDKRHDLQNIGNYVEIQYARNDPSHHKVIHFTPNEAFNIKLSFKGRDGNYQINLEKEFYNLEKTINHRKIQEFGQFEIHEDTLVLRKFLFENVATESVDLYLINKLLNEVEKLDY